MDNLQFKIAQGSTPFLELAFPFEVDGDHDVVYVDLAQGDKVRREWHLNGTDAAAGIKGTGTLSVSEDDDSVMVLAMSQADTLALSPGDAELQIRIKHTDGEEVFTDTFVPLVGAVYKAFKTGVIS